MLRKFDFARVLSAIVGIWATAFLAITVAAPARAQQASNSTYGGLLFDRSTLTGDWGGARDDLAAHGITITPSLTQFYQGPITGNTEPIFDYGGKAEAFVNVDGGKLGLWNGISLTVHGEYNFGKTPGGVGGTTIPNNLAMTFPYENEPGGDLSSVFLTQRFGSNFTLMAGKINMLDLYASGHEYSGGRGIETFWNAAFAGPPSGTVPVSAFGAIGIYKLDPLTFTLMVYDPNDALNRTGFEHPFSDGVTVRPSLTVSSTPFGLARTDSFTLAVSDEPGTDFGSLPDLSKFNTPAFKQSLINAFIYQEEWGHDSELYLPQGLTSAVTEKAERNYVAYAFEQTLWRSPSDTTKSWGLFGQVAESEGNPNSLKWSALGGISANGPWPGRPDDKFGVGVFYYDYSNILKQKLAPLLPLDNEYGIESFYNFAITKWFRLSADVQVIAPAVKSPLSAPPLVIPTAANNSPVVFMGLRSQVLF